MVEKATIITPVKAVGIIEEDWLTTLLKTMRLTSEEIGDERSCESLEYSPVRPSRCADYVNVRNPDLVGAVQEQQERQ